MYCQWFGGVVFAVTAFYLYRKFYCHRVFKRLGIPGPEPHWLFGNTLQLFRDDRHLVIAKWTASYGNFFGYYLGSQPILVVSTTDAVENICVKQFADFQGHMVLPIQPDPEKDPNNPLGHMFFAKGETWKRLRTICSPAFSSGKLKSYMSLISKSQNDLMELLSEKAKSGRDFNARECYQYLTLEVIGEVGFGLQFNAIKERGEGNFLLKQLRNILDRSTKPPPAILMALIFTELVGLIRFVVLSLARAMAGPLAPVGYLISAVRQIIAQRQQPNSRRNDILQMMIDVSSPEKISGLSVDEAKRVVKELSPFKSLSENEMVAQCLLLFIAGYETTSTSLGFATYLLAKNPDVQEKLASELAKHFPRNNNDSSFPEIDYETAMNNIPYLDWVCKESLRLYPVGMNVLSRFVERDTVLCGVTVPKSVYAVQIDTWAIHHDESLWGPVDPSKFYPERFSPENSVSRPDSAFLPFGFGPRLCLGIRLALLEMKVTLINILLRFRIAEPDEGYPGGELKIMSKNGPLSPATGRVMVKLLPRESS